MRSQKVGDLEGFCSETLRRRTGSEGTGQHRCVSIRIRGRAASRVHGQKGVAVKAIRCRESGFNRLWENAVQGLRSAGHQLRPWGLDVCGRSPSWSAGRRGDPRPLFFPASVLAASLLKLRYAAQRPASWPDRKRQQATAVQGADLRSAHVGLKSPYENPRPERFS